MGNFTLASEQTIPVTPFCNLFFTLCNTSLALNTAKIIGGIWRCKKHILPHPSCGLQGSVAGKFTQGPSMPPGLGKWRKHQAGQSIHSAVGSTPPSPHPHSHSPEWQPSQIHEGHHRYRRAAERWCCRAQRQPWLPVSHRVPNTRIFK